MDEATDAGGGVRHDSERVTRKTMGPLTDLKAWEEVSVDMHMGMENKDEDKDKGHCCFLYLSILYAFLRRCGHRFNN